ncbi:MAG: GIY-YIG nuclease family protein [Opitutales bacterium]
MKFHYVYRLVSIPNPGRHYVGLTDDLEARLKRHNAGFVAHTSKYTPWQIESAHAFRTREKAVEFEAYLKTHVGREFARRHL